MHKRVMQMLTDDQLEAAIKQTVENYEEMLNTGRTWWGLPATDRDKIKTLQSLTALHNERARRKYGVDGMRGDNDNE